MSTTLMIKIGIILFISAIFFTIMTMICYFRFDIKMIHNELLNRVDNQIRVKPIKVFPDKTSMIYPSNFIIIEDYMEIHSDVMIGGTNND